MGETPDALLLQLRERYAAGERPEFLFFWGHEALPDASLGTECLSQWYPAPFTLDGVHYPSAEHFMMAAKARLFDDREMFERIVAAPDPGAALSLGRQVRGYDQAAWEDARYAIVLEGSNAKFLQYPALREFLLGTGDKVLAQATPLETIWGIGLAPQHRDATNPARWRGLNLLGFALMQVRGGLAREANPVGK